MVAATSAVSKAADAIGQLVFAFFNIFRIVVPSSPLPSLNNVLEMCRSTQADRHGLCSTCQFSPFCVFIVLFRLSIAQIIRFG